jgi:hypothetical protein
MKKKVIALVAVAVLAVGVPAPAQAGPRFCASSDQQDQMSHIRFFWTWFYGSKC